MLKFNVRNQSISRIDNFRPAIADTVADDGTYTYDATTGIITIYGMVGNVVIEANGVVA